MINSKIKPETPLEEKIISDPEFMEGMLYGKPRRGHPEGKVIFHIEEVLKNVDKYCTPENREKLRLIAILHDAFKYKVNHEKAKMGENHHAMIARRFSEKHLNDLEILEIIELHDEAYNAWSTGKKGNWFNALERAERLIERLQTSVPLYLAFYRCDNETGNKGQDNYLWFVNIVQRVTKENVL
jgi:hypothetical protein